MQSACAILSSVACLSLPHFSTLSNKRHDFRSKKNVTEHEMCVLISSTTFVSDISHSEKDSASYDQKCLVVFMSSTRYSCQISMILEFSKQFFEKNNEM